MGLSDDDVRAVMETARAIRHLDPSSLESVDLLLGRLVRLVPADVVSAFRADLRGGTVDAVVRPRPGGPACRARTDAAAVVRSTSELGDHPLLAFWARTQSCGAVRVSDVTGRPAPDDDVVDRDVVRPFGGGRHVLAVPVRVDPDAAEGYAFGRKGRDFSVRDRDVGRALQAALVVLHRPSLPRTASPLTAREAEVIRLLSEGHSAQAISHRLGTTQPTVRKHLQHIYAKLGAHDRLTAVNQARDLHLLPRPRQGR